MSYDLGNINAKEVVAEDKAKFGTVPDGKYPVMMTNYEAKQGQKGEYLNAEFQIIEGEYKGRKFFDRYFVNGSDTAIRIAHSKMSAIAVAVGVENLKNLDQIVNKPFTCKVGTEAGTGNYPDKNKFVSAEPLKSGAVAPKPVKKPESAPGIDAFEDDDII